VLEEVALPPIGGSPRTDCLRGTGVIVDFHQHRFGEAFAACGCLALNFWRDQLDRPDKRREFFYWTDDGNLAGLRFDQYKVVFMEQPAHGLEVWMQPLVPLRAPKIFNLRSDPFERAEHEAGGYDKWFVEHAFVLVPAQAIVGQHLATFQEFPPRQKPGSFSVDQAMDLMMKQKSNN
jgi:hypothetical protein